MLHVRVIAPIEMRLALVQARCRVPAEVAAARIEASDAAAQLLKRHFSVCADDPYLYDLILNMAHMDVEPRSIWCAWRPNKSGSARDPRARHTTSGCPRVANVARPAASFTHPVEVEFARILDFYGIPWEYEPRTFVLDGRPATVSPKLSAPTSTCRTKICTSN